MAHTERGGGAGRARRARVRATREGEPLCVQGHAAATAFVVLKGKLEALEKKPSSSSSDSIELVDFDADADARGQAS